METKQQNPEKNSIELRICSTCAKSKILPTGVTSCRCRNGKF